MEALKAKATRIGRITPSLFARKWDYTISGAEMILRRWREGRYVCENKPNCILEKAGLKGTVASQISESRKAFLALKGEKFTAYLAETTVVRVGEPMECVGASQSQLDWLWVSVILKDDNTKPKLGDQMWLDNRMWGTIIDIEGRHITILLPSSHHGSRLKSGS